MLGQVAPTASAAPTEQVDAAMMATVMAQKAQLIATTYQLDKAGFHEIDVALNGSQPAPSGALGNVRRARVALLATSWPDPMQATVSELASQMQRLDDALRNEDWAGGVEPAKAVHDLGHDLSAMSYQWLSGQDVKPRDH